MRLDHLLSKEPPVSGGVQPRHRVGACCLRVGVCGGGWLLSSARSHLFLCMFFCVVGVWLGGTYGQRCSACCWVLRRHPVGVVFFGGRSRPGPSNASPYFSVVVGGCGGGCGVGVWWCVECCIVDASIYFFVSGFVVCACLLCVKCCRAQGGCLGIRSR